MKTLLVIISVIIYGGFVHLESDIAMKQLDHLRRLYTVAYSESSAVSASATAGNKQLASFKASSPK